jgi:hypothetical protein
MRKFQGKVKFNKAENVYFIVIYMTSVNDCVCMYVKSNGVHLLKILIYPSGHNLQLRCISGIRVLPTINPLKPKLV